MASVSSPLYPVIRRTMLFILLFSGLCSGLHHQYHLVKEKKTWNEAQSYCREKLTDLATIDDMDDMKRLIDSAGRGYEGIVWIGLHDKPDSWRWSLSDQGFYGQGETNFRMWRDSEPNNKDGRQFCVSFNRGLWRDFGCDVTFGFVCYTNTNILGLPVSTSDRYIYVSEPKTWTEAQRYCRQHHTDLASVRNQTENQEIQKVVPSEARVWIGLFRDSWRWWSGGSGSSFRYWKDGQPGNEAFHENCAASEIGNRGKWSDRKCENKYDFICYNRAEKHVFKIKLTSADSTVDLNDPAVMEAILKQMERKMDENGMSKDVKLRWRKGPDGKVFHKEEKKKNAVLV